MNKNILLFVASLFLLSIANAQQKHSLLYELVAQRKTSVSNFVKSNFFKKSLYIQSAKGLLSKKMSLALDKVNTLKIYHTKPSTLSLSIPFNNNNFTLLLIQQDINTSGDFSFGINKDSVHQKITSDQGVHYRGYIAGDSSSFASISIFDNGEMMGIFCNADGNYTIGRVNNNTDEYILYNNNDFQAALPFSCTTIEDPVTETDQLHNRTGFSRALATPALLCKKVRFYWEGDYKLYSYDFGYSLTYTRNYILGLFNQVSTMYQNEGILIELASSYVWTTQDPYTTTSSTNGLSTFTSYWNTVGNSFKGDLALLLDGGTTTNGGKAYLKTNLCTRSTAYAYANVHGYYNSVPTYSWDVNVATHEIGHLLGSHHTHWCGWSNGDCGAIDDCYALEASTVCTTCPVITSIEPSVPAGFKGTVMSYCHLVSGAGINLANGFGPLPQAVIRDLVDASSCTIYKNVWTGEIGDEWEEPGNWGCGMIPNANTDVILVEGCPDYPVVKSAAICRSLKQNKNTSVKVNTNYKLTIVGQ